jgi:hypothetical protein
MAAAFGQPPGRGGRRAAPGARLPGLERGSDGRSAAVAPPLQSRGSPAARTAGVPPRPGPSGGAWACPAAVWAALPSGAGCLVLACTAEARRVRRVRRVLACQRPGCSPLAAAAPPRWLATRLGGRSARRRTPAVPSVRPGQAQGLASARSPRTCAAPLRARSPWTPLLAARGALNALLQAAATLARHGPDIVSHLRAPAWGSLFHCHGCARETRRHSK